MPSADIDDGMTGEVGKKKERKWLEEREDQEEQEEWDDRDKQEQTTKGKEAPADQGKKLRRGWLIFRKESTKDFIDRLALWFDVVNTKDRRQAISP